jgi:hypothetical protein
MAPTDIGTRRELFVDDHLIAEQDGTERRLHHPERREIVLVHDEPWEGRTGYYTVFEDNGRYRMYYRNQVDDREIYTTYAESDDGLDWRKPDLGRYEFDGSTANNILFGTEFAGDPGLTGVSGNFTPFRDPTVDSGPVAYKAVGAGDETVGRGGEGLLALQSPDGIEWSVRSEEPIFTDAQGSFDSQNLAFWDPVREEYRAYFRAFTGEELYEGRRIIKTATSEDFREWSDPVPVEYSDDRDEEMYTNGVRPYYRAPHILVGFPARYVERDPESESMRQLPGWSEQRREFIEGHGRRGYGLTDALFISSRDGVTFDRADRAFLRPGLWERDSTAQWFYGDNFLAWHVVETPSPEAGKPRELSWFGSEWSRSEPTRLRRYSLRLDGFVSVQAPGRGGELVTTPLEFAGDEFVLNYATSVAGSVAVELQRPDGTPYDGFSLAESPELFGDDLDRVVEWAGGRTAGELAGDAVRVRFVLSDADIYSFRVRPSD